MLLKISTPLEDSKFTVRFDAIPGERDAAAAVGLNHAAGDMAGVACIILFDSTGKVKALDGDTFTSVSDISYTPGTEYHIRLAVNLHARTYSAYITAPGVWYENMIGFDYKFNNSGGNAEKSNNIGVCNENGSISAAGITSKPFSITRPVLFGIADADNIMRSLKVFPPDSHWNTDISSLPVLRNSDEMIAGIGADKALDYNLDMNYVFVPSDQKRVDVSGLAYPDECDPGPYPIPDNAPLENWPLHRNENKAAVPYPGESFEEFQLNGEGDRHVLVIDPDAQMLHEFWRTFKTDNAWIAATAVTFNLRTNAMRPDKWTSADAAGLPVFPAVVRYDEVEDGMVKHAMRFTVKKTRREFIYPASHYASPHTDINLPRMGERFRLKQDFDISPFPPHVRAILKGLKKYGMFIADNGQDLLISISPDVRIKGLETLNQLRGSDFEVVDVSSLPIPTP